MWTTDFEIACKRILKLLGKRKTKVIENLELIEALLRKYGYCHMQIQECDHVWTAWPDTIATMLNPGPEGTCIYCKKLLSGYGREKE